MLAVGKFCTLKHLSILPMYMQIQAVYDSAGSLIRGHPTKPKDVIDYVVLERSLSKEHPGWRIAAKLPPQLPWRLKEMAAKKQQQGGSVDDKQTSPAPSEQNKTRLVIRPIRAHPPSCLCLGGEVSYCSHSCWTGSVRSAQPSETGPTPPSSRSAFAGSSARERSSTPFSTTTPPHRRRSA